MGRIAEGDVVRVPLCDRPRLAFHADVRITRCGRKSMRNFLAKSLVGRIMAHARREILSTSSSKQNACVVLSWGCDAIPSQYSLVPPRFSGHAQHYSISKVEIGNFSALRWRRCK